MLELYIVRVWHGKTRDFIIDRDHLLSSTVRDIGVRAKGVFFYLEI
jgi:hypothetical protein